MSPAERRQFYEKHIRHMTLTIDENGNVNPAVHLFEQCVYLDVLAVAGVEVIQIAVEYP